MANSILVCPDLDWLLTSDTSSSSATRCLNPPLGGLQRGAASGWVARRAVLGSRVAGTGEGRAKGFNSNFSECAQ